MLIVDDSVSSVSQSNSVSETIAVGETLKHLHVEPGVKAKFEDSSSDFISESMGVFSDSEPPQKSPTQN